LTTAEKQITAPQGSQGLQEATKSQVAHLILTKAQLEQLLKAKPELRGKVDYASLSTSDLGQVERLSILVMSEKDGATVPQR
jgi:hypothetical protein